MPPSAHQCRDHRYLYIVVLVIDMGQQGLLNDRIARHECEGLTGTLASLPIV